MDGAQLTGATSSYARKYALNGLFCIDDNKDSDSSAVTALTRQESPAPASAPTPRPAIPTEKKADSQRETQITPRDHLLALLRSRNIDILTYAKEHNLTKDTPPIVYASLITELEGGETVG